MLTEKQKRLIQYIAEYRQDNLKPPTFREMAHEMKVKNTKSITDMLTSLQKKGYVERKDAPGKSRSIVLTDMARDLLGLNMFSSEWRVKTVDVADEYRKYPEQFSVNDTSSVMVSNDTLEYRDKKIQDTSSSDADDTNDILNVTERVFRLFQSHETKVQPIYPIILSGFMALSIKTSTSYAGWTFLVILIAIVVIKLVGVGTEAVLWFLLLLASVLLSFKASKL